MTADHDRLCDRLEQILSALPVIESRRDTVGAAAMVLDTLSRSSPPGEDIKPTTAKQADLTADLCDRLEQMLNAPDVERRRDAAKDAVDFLFSVSWIRPASTSTQRPGNKQTRFSGAEEAGWRAPFPRQPDEQNRPRRDGVRQGPSRSAGPDGGGCTARPGTVTRSARKAAQEPRRLGRLDCCLGVLSTHGKLPTLCTDPEGRAHGPFVDFLAAVFGACGIAASAEARAKVFIRKFCRPRRELEMRQ